MVLRKRRLAYVHCIIITLSWGMDSLAASGGRGGGGGGGWTQGGGGGGESPLGTDPGRGGVRSVPKGAWAMAELSQAGLEKSLGKR